MDNILKRSNCNFYDECMNSPDELFETSEPFCTQSSEFALGHGESDVDSLVRPTQFPNQLIYASSAGRTDQYLYRKYRECSLYMDAGSKDHFCADISCDVVINATRKGVLLPKPLLEQSVVDARMREDKESGLREYKNIFTSEGGDGQIISRASIIKNSAPRVPELYNIDNKSLYAIAYDPARSHDNSVIGIGKYYQDPDVGWKMQVVNFVSLADLLTKSKTPMNTPNQIKALKDIIAAYNGEQVADYENIISILVDAGSGGAGVPITDFLCEDWEDSNGVTHRGLIDSEYKPEEKMKVKYPNAIDGKLRLIAPAKYKSELFESLIKMVDSNLIEFPEEYMNKGYINLLYQVDKTGKKTQIFKYPSEEEEKNLNKKGITIENIPVHLDRDEESALKQIDAMKTEVVNIYRFKQSNGKDRFDLEPSKAGKMHDDRGYVMALLGYQLAQLRRDHIVNKKTKRNTNIADLLPIHTAKRNTMFS